MNLDVIVGGLTGAGICYVWIWQRYRYLKVHAQRRRAIETFERQLREARDELGERNPVRAAGDDDRELVALLAAASTDERALLAGGFTALGELVLQHAGKPPAAILRAFVDGTGSTCAMVGVHCKQPSSVRVSVVSYRGDDVYATRRAPWPGLAEPPFVHVKVVPVETTAAELVARHREHAGSQPSIPLATRDALLAQLAATRARTVAWRAAQAPDELLDADLRGVLGVHYDKHGKAWARRLRGELPQATVRKA